jgi:hypothetical protein
MDLLPIICSLLSCLSSGLCCFLFFIMLVGIIVLRKRGKKVSEVSAKEILDTGMESATGVFKRSQLKKDAPEE